MEDKNKNEELDLDNLMKSLPKGEVGVPLELEQRLNCTLNNLKRKRSISRWLVSVCAAVCVFFIVGVKWNPAFASYAASVPVLKPAVEWIRGDKGIANARKHESNQVKGMIIEENGYKISLEDIFFDEDRVRIAASLIGEETGTSSEEKAKEDTAGHISIRFLDFEDPGAVSVWHSSEKESSFTYEIEKSFKKGEVTEFLGKNQLYLNLAVEINKGKEKIYTFENIKLPYSLQNFNYSKLYNQNLKTAFEKGSVNISHVSVSPTRMRVDVQAEMEKGYEFAGFENARLEDEKGNVYKPEGLVSMQRDEKSRSLYFVPSIYFEKMPQKLLFCFDGVRIASMEGKTFTLKLDDKYPKTVQYMGQDIIVEKIELQENEKLAITYVMPDPKVLSINNMRLEDYQGVTSWEWRDYTEADPTAVKRFRSWFECGRREEYGIELGYPGYFIPAGSKLELNTK